MFSYTNVRVNGTDLNTQTQYISSSVVTAVENHSIIASRSATTYSLRYNANGGEGSPEDQTKT